MAKRSDVWLNLKPGSNIAMMNGLAHVILKNGWENKEFIKTRTESFDEFIKQVKKYDLKKVEKLTGAQGGRTYVEAVVSANSALTGVTVRESRFRTTHNAAIIAVYRKGPRILITIGDNRELRVCLDQMAGIHQLTFDPACQRGLGQPRPDICRHLGHCHPQGLGLLG